MLPSDSTSAEAVSNDGQFRLAHLFYAIALIASGMALLGDAGIMVAGLILLFWLKIVVLPRWPISNATFLGLLMLLGFVCAVVAMMPALVPAIDAMRCTQCQNNLKTLGLALRTYHSTYGKYPPAYVSGPDGKPWHSWRILLLPYIGEAGLYARYRFDEPWNGPHNAELARRMPDVFGCPSPSGRRPGKTCYSAIVGARTMWPNNRSTNQDQLRDGINNCFALIEIGASDIDWHEPRDMTQGELTYLLAPGHEAAIPTGFGHSEQTFFCDTSWRLHVLYADGTPTLVHFGQAPEEIERRCDINDGNILQPLGGGGGYSRPRWDNWYRLGLFLFLAVLPTPWAIVAAFTGASQRTSYDTSTEPANPHAVAT